MKEYKTFQKKKFIHNNFLPNKKKENELIMI